MIEIVLCDLLVRVPERPTRSRDAERTSPAPDGSPPHRNAERWPRDSAACSCKSNLLSHGRACSPTQGQHLGPCACLRTLEPCRHSSHRIREGSHLRRTIDLQPEPARALATPGFLASVSAASERSSVFVSDWRIRSAGAITTSGSDPSAPFGLGSFCLVLLPDYRRCE